MIKRIFSGINTRLTHFVSKGAYSKFYEYLVKYLILMGIWTTVTMGIGITSWLIQMQ